MRRHIPLYVSICLQPYRMCAEPYCGQDRDVPDTKPAVAKKTKAPRRRGFNRGLLRRWGLREAHCHLNNVRAATPFPSKIEAARVRGVPAIPRRSPRTPLSPGPHRQSLIVGKQDGGKGELQD